MKLSYITIACIMCALVLIVPSSAVNVGTIINRGATIFVGEQGLDISRTLFDKDGVPTNSIAIWQVGSSLTTQPLRILDLGSNHGENFDATNIEIGSWYAYNSTDQTRSKSIFNVMDPNIRLIIMNNGIDVSGETVTKDTVLTFKIISNLYSMSNRYNDESLTPINETSGFINLKVISPNGATYINVVGSNGNRTSTENILPTSSAFVWNGDWKLNAVDANQQKIYLAGNYSVIAESTLNDMNINYEVIGKTKTNPVTVTIGFTSVVLTINKESVMRNKPFSVTIVGSQNSNYNLWIKGTSKMTDPLNQPPKISESQAGVLVDDPLVSCYTYQNSGGRTIGTDVPSLTGHYFANVTTDLDGTRTVQFDTNPNTESKKYTIRVEENSSGQYKYDEVTVEVGKGTMTIVTQGYQNYYTGEIIKISGTNTESYETYLFITGPNLPTQGAKIDSLDPRSDPVVNNDRDTFHVEQVDGGDWSWDMPTTGLALDAGTYTIYALTGPSDRSHLNNVTYATTSITLRKPFVSAAMSQSTVAKGDTLFVRGIAEGNPSTGVQIWIMGKNYMTHDTASTDSSSSFEYEIDRTLTSGLANGQYFVVVQHPMQNGQFDIILKDGYIVNLQLGNETEGGTKIFQIEGSGSLQGPDAAQALITALDNQNIDDTYTKLQFLVDQPLITLDQVGDRHIGDKFTITGKTNLAVDDNVLIEVYSSTFQPTQKVQSGEFSGATGTVKVIASDGNDGYNRIEFSVDASTFREDEYIVIAKATDVDASGSTTFNVLGQSLYNQTSITPTVVPMSTLVPTPNPTTVAPTPTPTPKSPGFSAIFALIGICIIGFVITRRE